MDSLHRHSRCLSPCPDAQGRKKVSAICGQQASLPIHLSTSPREFTKLLCPVVALLWQRGVKLHIYLDDWLIRADTPKQAQLHAQMTISMLQFLGWIISYEKSDLTPSQDFQFIGMQFNTRQFTVAPLPKMRLKVQSVHQHWMTNPIITGTAIFTDCWACWCLWLRWYRGEDSVFVGSSSGLPQLGARGLGTQVRQDNSSSVGSVRSGLVGISSSPTRSSPRHQGNGSDSLHGCIQFGLGSPVTFWRCRPSSMLWETSFLIWGPEWCTWCATTQWQWLTSRTREAHDLTHSCRWCCACWNGAIARR